VSDEKHSKFVDNSENVSEVSDEVLPEGQCDFDFFSRNSEAEGTPEYFFYHVSRMERGRFDYKFNFFHQFEDCNVEFFWVVKVTKDGLAYFNASPDEVINLDCPNIPDGDWVKSDSDFDEWLATHFAENSFLRSIEDRCYFLYV